MRTQGMHFFGLLAFITALAMSIFPAMASEDLTSLKTIDDKDSTTLQRSRRFIYYDFLLPYDNGPVEGEKLKLKGLIGAAFSPAYDWWNLVHINKDPIFAGMRDKSTVKRHRRTILDEDFHDS